MKIFGFNISKDDMQYLSLLILYLLIMFFLLNLIFVTNVDAYTLNYAKPIKGYSTTTTIPDRIIINKNQILHLLNMNNVCSDKAAIYQEGCQNGIAEVNDYLGIKKKNINYRIENFKTLDTTQICFPLTYFNYTYKTFNLTNSYKLSSLNISYNFSYNDMVSCRKNCSLNLDWNKIIFNSNNTNFLQFYIKIK